MESCKKARRRKQTEACLLLDAFFGSLLVKPLFRWEKDEQLFLLRPSDEVTGVLIVEVKHGNKKNRTIDNID